MENMENQVHVVITRYNEYIDWIRYIVEKVDLIYIYNKGPNTNFFDDRSGFSVRFSTLETE